MCMISKKKKNFHVIYLLFICMCNFIILRGENFIIVAFIYSIFSHSNNPENTEDRG